MTKDNKSKHPTHEEWDLINDKITEVTRLIQKSGLTMVSATYGTDDEINHWQYKFWIPKSKQKKLNIVGRK